MTLYRFFAYSYSVHVEVMGCTSSLVNLALAVGYGSPIDRE
jgi:hypothetical protein